MFPFRGNKSKRSGFRSLSMSVLFLVVPFTQFLNAQDEIIHIRNSWQQGAYSEVLPKLLDYRKKPYGKNAAVDYMIATSACRISDHEEIGQKFFDWMLDNYSLGKTRKLVESERDKCASDTEPSRLAFATLRTGGSVGVSGKTYYWLGNEKSLDGQQNALISSDPVEVIKEIPYEKISERLFGPSNKQGAAEYYQNMLGDKFKVKTFNSFIIASSGKHTAAEIENVNQLLEKYITFFSTQYKMPLPPYLITVYLVPTMEMLKNLAKEIHGIKISRGSIGYSFRDDFSILGVIPTNRIGTLLHELFHIMTRNNFGDIPPWLDEGMASLYEVSKLEDDAVLGLPNWRGAVLKEFWSLRPSIKSLVGMDWFAFDGTEASFQQKAANHATARYFTLYLQEKNKLADVYEAFQARDVLTMPPDSPLMNPQHIVRAILDQPFPETDADFTKWFEQF